jgi:hypothetical protein
VSTGCFRHAGGDLDGENGEEDHGADMDVDDDGWEVLSLDLDNDEMAGDDDIFPSSVAAMAAGTSSISSSTVAPTGGFFGMPQSGISAKATGKMRTPSLDS